jgi:hypothetical protein
LKTNNLTIDKKIESNQIESISNNCKLSNNLTIEQKQIIESNFNICFFQSKFTNFDQKLFFAYPKLNIEQLKKIVEYKKIDLSNLNNLNCRINFLIDYKNSILKIEIEKLNFELQLKFEIFESIEFSKIENQKQIDNFKNFDLQLIEIFANQIDKQIEQLKLIDSIEFQNFLKLQQQK